MAGESSSHHDYHGVNHATVAVILVLAAMPSCALGGKIKIIDGPFSSGGSNAVNDHHMQQVKLKTDVDPQPVSGPGHFTRLNGKCFALTKQSFTYEFCPFHNLTQREQSYRWNAFHGFLGVWKEWMIENNTFVGMKMEHGDRCVANIYREAKVFLSCGEADELMDVKEPITCKYEVRFKTPGACPKDAFMVYPSLSHSGKAAWDHLQKRFNDDEITPQGYIKELKSIFIKEGLQMKPGEMLVKSQTASGKDGKANQDTRFSSFAQCIKEHDKVLEELKKLKRYANASAYLETNPEARESVAARVISELVKQTQKLAPKGSN